MPHLLIAGATGTGKSVSLNAMIMSILFKAPPRDVRFVMIDLKMLELSLYEELPHLLVPVVTDPKKAVVVLKNLVEQMDQRYRLLKEKGVRNLDGYNQLIAQEEQEHRAGVIELNDIVDDEPAEPAVEVLRHEHLPKIVIIIDELADLMMTVGRDVEEPITRLAQKARACGMHLILATQRPSVDVITGLIKANFPARISFQVTARVDSRTILDCIGAERLLGGGDMLYLPPGTARVQRLHGAFVSEAEIRKVTDFAKQQARPQYALDLLEGQDDEAEGGTGVDDGYDDVMYDQAVRLVTESRQASISWVQRRLRVGYNRAARMIERMEREGVVSTSEGGRPREVLAQRIDEE
jgi:S-DNA-T family DNA segregation ATPase FtsK/SpoIIIE